MNWIILTIAGCFEVLFTFCMGKVKETTGTEMYLWFTGFLIATLISMLLLVKATHNLPIGHSLCRIGRGRCRGYGTCRYSGIQRTCRLLEALLYSDVNRFDYRIEDGVARIERSNL